MFYELMFTVGKGLANPTALLLSSLMMLRYVLGPRLLLPSRLIWPQPLQAHEPQRLRVEYRESGAFRTQSSSFFSMLVLDSPHVQTIAEGKTITGDLGGKSSTSEYTAAIIDKLAKA